MTIETVLIPVTFSESFTTLQKKINEFNPDIVMCFGQAAGSESIQLESVALNSIDADIPDNQGHQPQKEMINHLGELSYLATLPIQGLDGALKDAGIPSRISNSAGTYVCNYLFYRLMETNQDTLRLCGFIHVPLLETMSLEDLKKALSVMLEYLDY